MFLPGPSASWWSPRWFQGTLPSWPGSRRRWPAWWRPRPSRQRHGYRPGPGARPQIAAGPEPRQGWTGSGRYSTCRYSTPGPRGPTSTASTPSTPPRRRPGIPPGWPQDGPNSRCRRLIGLVGSGPQKGPSWAILGVFAGPAPRAGPRPAPSFPGGSGVCWRVPSVFRDYPSFPHGSPPLSVFVPYMYRAESVYIPNMARVVIIFCLNSWE